MRHNFLIALCSDIHVTKQLSSHMKWKPGLKGWLKHQAGFTSRHWRTLLEAWSVHRSAAHIPRYLFFSRYLLLKFSAGLPKVWKQPTASPFIVLPTYVIYLATLKIFYSKDFTKVPICLGWGNARVWRFWKIRIHPVFSSFHEISSASDIMLNLSKSQRSIWIMLCELWCNVNNEMK